LCKWLNVSRSGYYDWRVRRPSDHSLKDRELLQRIRSIYKQSRGTYGSPRVHEALKQYGYAIGKKRVERLMREYSLKGRVVKVTRRQPGIKRFRAYGDNLRLLEPAPTQLNELWVADITYLNLGGKWLYLATVMDVKSRKIIGWSLSNSRTVELSITALKQALKHRKPCANMIFHTDRGVEYTAHRFRDELKQHGIRHSINRAGYCTDNAHMESFFHSLKAELIRSRTFKNEEELRRALKSYINHFYNQQRLHSGIGYLSPVEYEKMAA